MALINSWNLMRSRDLHTWCNTLFFLQVVESQRCFREKLGNYGTQILKLITWRIPEIISSNNTGGEEDFEDWPIKNDGDSNDFTAPGFLCFHFNGPHEILPEGLERFSRLFTLDEVETTIQESFVIPWEIGRVADELDHTSDASRAYYSLKRSINPEHPFLRFSAGSKETLITTPAEKGIDVASQLLRFFESIICHHGRLWLLLEETNWVL